MRHLSLITVAICLGLAAGARAQTSIATHDNLRPAGELRTQTLRIQLYASVGAWRPEGDNGPSVSVQAFGEEGRGLEIPGPLVRVPVGTTIDASIRNALDAPLVLHGFGSRPLASDEAVVIAPSETRRVTFAAGTAGTYHYWATTTGATTARRFGIDGQLSGAFIVDEPGAPPDRVFVTTMWAETSDPSETIGLTPSSRINFMFNGRAWPHTERLTYDAGDTVRWRIINLSAQPHPLHLHGFFFTVHASGNGLVDQRLAATAERRAVTELVRPGGTLQLSWIPDRPGNWLFHCHIVEHMTPYLSVAGSKPGSDHSDHTNGMGGMVIGVTVRSRTASTRSTVVATRKLTLTMKTVPKRFGQEDGFGFALDRERDAITPGPLLVLTRGEPVQITLVNELNEATAIHWHGIELDSYFDGVPGFGGDSGSVTPSIEPRGRFDVRFAPPRAGTYIYHTHSHDLTSLQKGLYGALIVLEPGRKYDAETDHVWILGVNGSERGAAGDDTEAILNGALTPTVSLKAGVPNRIRLINITAHRTGLTFFVMKGTDLATWKLLAKDGADVPASQRTVGPARQQVSVGETYDFELLPTEEMRVEVRRGGAGETLIRAPIVDALSRILKGPR